MEDNGYSVKDRGFIFTSSTEVCCAVLSPGCRYDSLPFLHFSS